MNKMPDIKNIAKVGILLTKRPFRISIEGNIGSGKSTFLKHFEKYSYVETHPVSRL